MKVSKHTLSFQSKLWVLRAFAVATFGYCFAIPIMVPHIHVTLGNAGDYFYLATIASATSLLFSIPLGILADHWGRKNSLLSGLFVLSISWFFLIYADSWIDFVIFFAVKGIGDSLWVSAAPGYLFDIMSEEQKPDEYQKEQSNQSSYAMPTMAFIILFSGVIYAYIPYISFVLNSAFYFILLIITALFMPALKAKKMDKKVEKLTLKSLIKSPVFYLAIGSGAWFGIISYTFFVFQALLVDAKASTLYLAIVIALIYPLRAVGAYFARKNITVSLLILLSIILITSMSLSYLFASSLIIVTSMMLIFSATRECFSVTATTQLTQQSPKNKISFIKSISTGWGSATSIAINALSALATTYYSNSELMLVHIFGLLLLCGLPAFIFWIKKTK